MSCIDREFWQTVRKNWLHLVLIEQHPYSIHQQLSNGLEVNKRLETYTKKIRFKLKTPVLAGLYRQNRACAGMTARNWVLTVVLGWSTEQSLNLFLLLAKMLKLEGRLQMINVLIFNLLLLSIKGSDPRAMSRPFQSV